VKGAKGSGEYNSITFLDLQIWTRKPQKKGKKPKKAIEHSIKPKESKKWLTGLISTELAIPSETTVVAITDREGDIYELFALETVLRLLINLLGSVCGVY
jgi:hypothetical protein